DTVVEKEAQVALYPFSLLPFSFRRRRQPPAREIFFQIVRVPPEAAKQPPTVLVKWYDWLRWLLDRVDSFPKNQRFIFGTRLADRAIGVLVIQANCELVFTASLSFIHICLHMADRRSSQQFVSFLR
ncbi:MAG: hypothetical protein WD669_07900, partial [Pirellulales bacterium]